MKRKLLASILGIAAVAATMSSYGQGQILFDNYANLTHNTQTTLDAVLATDTSIVIGLWAGADGAPAGSLQLIGTAAIFVSNTYGGGYYDGGAATIPSTLWTGTQNIEFQVRGSGGIGAFGFGVTGSSALWTELGANLVAIGNPQNEMANGPLPLALTSIVPEPTTFALVGLALGGLMIFRKRQ